MLAFGPEADSNNFYPLSGVFCRNFGWWCLLAGGWLTVQAFLRWWRKDTNPGGLSVYVGRLLAWLLVTHLAGELLWVLANLPHLETIFSYRLYTIWAVVQMLTTFVIVGMFVDCWHRQARWPVRQFMAPLLLLLVWQFTRAVPLSLGDVAHDLQGQMREAWKMPPSNPGAESYCTRDCRNKEWFDQFSKRLNEVEDGPFVIVAASGGGSRAAIFTALVYKALDLTPIKPSEPKPGDAPRRTWAQNIVLISSVSGGSLATAYLVKNGGAGDQQEFAKLRNTTPDELTARLRGWAKQLLLAPKQQPAEVVRKYLPDLEAKQSDEERLAYLTDKTSYQSLKSGLDQLRKQRNGLRRSSPEKEKDLAEKEKKLADLENQIIDLVHFLAMMEAYDVIRALPPHSEESQCLTKEDRQDFTSVLQSRMFDEMGLDFMAPIMRGALSPLSLDRGDSLARFWTRRFDWYNCTNFDGYGERAYQPADPLVVFNASDVALGTRLAIGFPTLPSDLWGPVYDTKKSTRARPISLSEWGPDYRISLARAVRMSSNFPFGFRSMELAVQTPAPPADGSAADAGLAEEQAGLHHVLDGGVVDNTGLDTLYALFYALDTYAKKTDRECEADGELKDYRERSRQILGTLRRRGVVILEIDAGAKPDETVSGKLNPFAGQTEPIQALNNAAYTGADQDKELYLKEIGRILNRDLSEITGGDKAKEATVAWLNDNRPVTTLHLAIQCNHYTPGQEKPNAEVMTAWALGPQDKAEVVHRFLMEMAGWRMNRSDVWDDLTEGMNKFQITMDQARELLRNPTNDVVHRLFPRPQSFGPSNPQWKYDQSSRRKQMFEK